MSRAIWKYALTAPHSTVVVQEPGIVRHVAGQHGNPTLWVEVDPDDPRGGRLRSFEVVATGQSFRLDDPMYLGTALLDGLVWHVYELPA